MNVIRIMLILIGIALLIWFAIPPMFLGILNSGSYVGIAFSLCLIIYGFLSVIINNIIGVIWNKPSGKIVLIFLAVIISAIIVFVSVATYNMISAAHNPPEKDTTVVVLGCQVHSYGPSLMLTERLEAALAYLNENKDVKCIVSGGQGEDEPMSEAECMYRWLTERGIDKERVYIEDKSKSTRENLIFSKKIIEEKGLNPIMTIVTNDFHQYRAGKIAKSLNIESYSVSGKTFKTILPTYYVRELGGILYEWIKPMP